MQNFNFQILRHLQVKAISINLPVSESMRLGELGVSQTVSLNFAQNMVKDFP